MSLAGGTEEKDFSQYLERDIVGVVLQYLQEKGYWSTIHMLESETQYYFDMKHFKELWIEGSWDELISYLYGFIKPEKVQEHSALFFEILKQRFLDALEKDDKDLATFILKKDVVAFLNLDEKEHNETDTQRERIYNEFLTMYNQQDNSSRHTDKLPWKDNSRETRQMIYPHIENYLLEMVPSIKCCVECPKIPQKGRLRTIINQSLNFQLKMEKEKNSKPVVKTLFTDYSGTQESDYGNYSFAVKQRIMEQQRMLEMKQKEEEQMEFEKESQNGEESESKEYKKKVTKRSRSSLSSTLRKATKRKKKEESESEGESKSQEELYEPPMEMVLQLPLEASQVCCVSFYPNNEYVLLVGSKHGISVWDLSKNSSILSIPMDPVRKFVWSPCGRFVAALFENGASISAFEIKESDGQVGLSLVNAIGDLNASITTIQFMLLPTYTYSTKGRLVILVASEDGLIRIYDLCDQMSLKWQLEGHNNAIVSICTIQNRNVPMIISSSVDGLLCVWLLPENKCNEGEEKKKRAPLSVSPNISFERSDVCIWMCYGGDSKIYSIASNNALVELNMVNGKSDREFDGFKYSPGTHILLGPNNIKTIIANSKNSVVFISVEKGKKLYDLNFKKKVVHFDISKSGNLLVVIDLDEVKVFSNSKGSNIQLSSAPKLKTERQQADNITPSKYKYKDQEDYSGDTCEAMKPLPIKPLQNVDYSTEESGHHGSARRGEALTEAGPSNFEERKSPQGMARRSNTPDLIVAQPAEPPSPQEVVPPIVKVETSEMMALRYQDSKNEDPTTSVSAPPPPSVIVPRIAEGEKSEKFGYESTGTEGLTASSSNAQKQSLDTAITKTAEPTTPPPTLSQPHTPQSQTTMATPISISSNPPSVSSQFQISKYPLQSTPSYSKTPPRIGPNVYPPSIMNQNTPSINTDLNSLSAMPSVGSNYNNMGIMNNNMSANMMNSLITSSININTTATIPNIQTPVNLNNMSSNISSLGINSNPTRNISYPSGFGYIPYNSTQKTGSLVRNLNYPLNYSTDTISTLSNSSAPSIPSITGGSAGVGNVPSVREGTGMETFQSESDSSANVPPTTSNTSTFQNHLDSYASVFSQPLPPPLPSSLSSSLSAGWSPNMSFLYSSNSYGLSTNTTNNPSFNVSQVYPNNSIYPPQMGSVQYPTFSGFGSSANSNENDNREANTNTTGLGVGNSFPAPFPSRV